VGGLEFLAGIPGNVGGAIAMNGGTHLGEIAGALVEARVFRMAQLVFDRVRGPDLKFAYRKNRFLNPGDIIVSAVIRAKRESVAAVRAKLDELWKRRKQTQPVLL
jgi:UDP-N-acetylmuramate dehydrogenase